MIYEAKCGKCGETFNPADENDLEHIETINGDRCGGQGEMRASYRQDWRCEFCGGGDIHTGSCVANTGTYRT